MYKIPQNVMTFSEGNLDLYKAFTDLFRNYASDTYGQTTLAFNKEKSLDEKNKEVNELFAKEVKRVSGVEWSFGDATMATNPNVGWAAFAISNHLIDMILPETIVGSIGIYTDVKYGGFGDSFAFTVRPNDLFVVSKSGRNQKHTEVKKQFDGQVTVLPIEHAVTVEVSFYKVLTGQENLAEFVMKAVRSIETAITKDAYSAFSTAMDALPTTPVNGELKITGYTQDSAVKLAQTVTAYNMGKKAVFLGTQLAVSKILPTDANYRYTLESDYVKMGYVKTAFGYDVMVMPQLADWENKYKTLLADDKIYVVSPTSQKLIKLCIEGETLTNTDGTYDNANLSQSATIRKSWGVAVATNSVAGEIDLA